MVSWVLTSLYRIGFFLFYFFIAWGLLLVAEVFFISLSRIGGRFIV